MVEDVLSISIAVSIYSYVLPLLVGLMYFKKVPLALKLVLFYVIISFIVDFLPSKLNFDSRNIYTAFSFFIIIKIYLNIAVNRYFRIFIWSVVPVFLIFFLWRTDILGNVYEWRSDITSFSFILVSVIGIIFYFDMLGHQISCRVLFYPYFILNTAFLTYTMGTLFLFGLHDYMTADQWYYIPINTFFNLVKNVLLMFTFYRGWVYFGREIRAVK